MTRKKKDPQPRDLRREAIDQSLHKLSEHSSAVVIILATRESDRQDANGPIPPIVEWKGDMGSCYGILSVAFENAESYGLPVSEDDDADENGEHSDDKLSE